MICLGRAFSLLLLLLASMLPAYASHIVGGEVTYKWLGGNNYQIRLDIYQDCVNGLPTPIEQDDPAILAIFTGAGLRIAADSISASSTIIVPANFSNDCVNNPPRLCLRKQTFLRNYSLPANTSGYYIVYQRCCRNGIENINDATNTGTTNFAFIPPRAADQAGNTSAIFNNYPPQIICANNPFIYDHSASDINGDSLTYEFCTAYQGGSASDAKPVPQSINFQPVSYRAGFSATRPMTGNPPLQIDPKTGIISGTPDMTGLFVVTVCCTEWRNGVRINTIRRELQFTVTPCSKAVVANIPQYSDEFNTYIVQCKGRTVAFGNLSIGANSSYDAYSWDFGVAGTAADTSHQKEPTYTYPDTGVYIVKLIVNRGSTCTDSISRLVKIYPEFRTDFEVQGLHCPFLPLQFVNTTVSTYKPVVGYAWSFGDNTTSDEEHPVHTYITGGKYNVTLTARNVKGCTDTTVQEISIESFRPFAGNDTIIVKGEYIHFNASGGSFYTWSPSAYLNNPSVRNPIGYYPDTARLSYIVHVASEAGCEGLDTVNVWVVNQAAIFVPSAFSPNGDGRNDVLRPIGIGYADVNYFRIFNRWGQQVFYGTRFEEGWDGRYQGHTADIGTYYWQLSVTDRFGQELRLKGDSALLR